MTVTTHTFSLGLVKKEVQRILDNFSTRDHIVAAGDGGDLWTVKGTAVRAKIVGTDEFFPDELIRSTRELIVYKDKEFEVIVFYKRTDVRNYSSSPEEFDKATRIRITAERRD